MHTYLSEKCVLCYRVWTTATSYTKLSDGGNLKVTRITPFCSSFYGSPTALLKGIYALYVYHTVTD